MGLIRHCLAGLVTHGDTRYSKANTLRKILGTALER